MKDSNNLLKTTLRIIIAIAAWSALYVQLFVLISPTNDSGLSFSEAAWKLLKYFTILTNLLVAISMSISLLFPRSKPGLFFLRPTTQTAITVYIFIVGLVYNAILRQLWAPEGMQKLADELLHVLVPLLCVSYWFCFSPRHFLQWKHALQWMIYPAIYFLYAMIRGATGEKYAYPFIDVSELGYGIVLRNAAGMLVLFALTGLAFIFIARKLNGKRS